MNNSRILRNRNFMLLWSGNSVSLLGTSGVRIAYPLIVLAISGSPVLAGWVTFAVNLPSLLLQIPAGIVADFWNRRHTLLVCQAVGLAATGLATVTIIYRPPGLTFLLMGTGFIEGSIVVFYGLAELGAIRDVVTEEERPAAFSFYEAEQPASILVGRALGAALFGVARWLPFAADAISYVFCLGTLSGVPSRLLLPRPQQEVHHRGPTGSRIREGLRWAWSLPFVRASTLIAGCANVIFQTVILLVIVLAREKREPTWVVGVVLACTGVGGVLGSIAAPWITRRFRPQSVYIAGLWTWVLLLVPVALNVNPYLLAVAWCGVGAVGTVSSVALTIYRVGAVPDAVLGRVVGAVAIITDGAVPIGAVIAGYILAGWGAQVTGWILFTSMLTLALLGSLLAETVRAPTLHPGLGDVVGSAEIAN
jgi:MFS family permease